MRFISIVVSFLFLAGCGSSPSSVLPPVELTPLTNNINLSRQWIFTAGEGVSDHYLKLKPVFNNDIGYVVDYKGLLKSFKVKSGKQLWQVNLDLPVSGGLTYLNGKLFLGTSKGVVVALDVNHKDVMESGAKIIWQAQLSSEVLARPAVAKGIVVVKTIDGRVYGLKVRNGQQKWIYDRSVPRLTLRGSGTPVISNDVVITSSDSGKLTALSLRQGKLLWETTISVAKGGNQLERVIDIDTDPVVLKDVVYVAGYQGQVAAVKLGSGQIIWSRDFSSYSGLSVDAYRVYITDSNGQIWALNRYNGSTIWRQDILLRRQLSPPELHEKYLVVGDFDGYLHWFNRDDGKLVARKKMNSSDIILDDEEETDRELSLQFSKWYNILVKPMLVNNILLSIDRVGHLEAFKIEKD